MFGSESLEVLIGLALVFLLLSLVASALRELLESVFRTRGLYLERGIRELLDDPEPTVPPPETSGATDVKPLSAVLFEHPLVASLYRDAYKPATTAGGRIFRWLGHHNLPPYIPAANFTSALLDIIVRGRALDSAAGIAADSPRISLDAVRTQLPRLGNVRVGRAVLSAVDLAEGDMTQARANIEGWFNSSMDRVSGWYKRWTQLYLFVIGLGLAIWLNVNTITVARYLYRDQGAREAIVRMADATSRDSTILQQKDADSLLARLNALDLPIGWRYGIAGLRPGEDSTAKAFVSRRQALPLAILGWLITALAVTLGAPFWFDLLNRVMVVRSTVKPTDARADAGPDAGPATGASGASARGPTALMRGGSSGPLPLTPVELRALLPKEPATRPADSVAVTVTRP